MTIPLRASGKPVIQQPENFEDIDISAEDYENSDAYGGFLVYVNDVGNGELKVDGYNSGAVTIKVENIGFINGVFSKVYTTGSDIGEIIAAW